MMNRLLLLAALLLPYHARAALDVVTTTEGLAALVREVGGERVKVQSLSRGIQDPHFVDANPTLAVKLRQADLLVDVGLDLEIGWLPPLVNQSRNADIQPTGNPHFLSDPRRARKVAEGLEQKLTALDGAGAATYRQRLADFERRLDGDEARW